MSFQSKIAKISEQLATRPVFKRRHVVEGRPVIEVLEADPIKQRAARRDFRQATGRKYKELSKNDIFKISVLVRAVRGNGADVLAMAKVTRANDKTAVCARHEEVVAGLALAEAQGVDLDADWSKS